MQAKNYGEMQCPIYFNDYISISHNVYEFDPNARYKVLTLCTEPEIIAPYDSRYFANFDLILTNRQDILNRNENSRYMHSCTGATVEIKNNFNKLNKISYITSSKTITNLHFLRHEIFNLLKVFKSFNDLYFTCLMTPPKIESKNEILDEFKFSIAIENSVETNYFTEKIIDCFVTKTVPIYLGCPNIDEYFNSDGIIKFNSINDLVFILNNLTANDYERMQNAINENYEAALRYNNFWDSLSQKINDYFYNKGE